MKAISFSAVSDLRLGGLERDPAAVEDDEAVGDIVDVVDVVADEEDRAAARAHGADEAEDLLGLGQRQRRGRLVEHDQVGLVVDGAGDGDALALAAGKLADDRIRA